MTKLLYIISLKGLDTRNYNACFNVKPEKKYVQYKYTDFFNDDKNTTCYCLQIK